MLNVLESLLNTITGVITFLINTITSLVTFIVNIPTYVSFIVNSLNVMPQFLLPFMTLCISVYVVLFIINRK